MGEFELLAADIGQGNAVLVRTATHSLLYDAGPRYSPESDAGQRVLVPLLRAFGERLDSVVLSHRDSDHTGGAAAVLTAHPKAELLSSIEAEHPLQALRTARRCEAGQRWTWDGVAFEVLNRPRPTIGPSPSPMRSRAFFASPMAGQRPSWPVTSSACKRPRWSLAHLICAPTFSWCRTMEARPRRAICCSTPCSRASPWSRPATATDSGIRRRRWSGAMSSAA